jgi:hypothetical protein
MSNTTVNANPNVPSEGLIPSTPRWLNRLLLCTAVLTLLGCASIKVTPLPTDTPLSSAANLGGKPVYCLQLGTKNYDYKLNRKVLVKLAPGESCWYIVQSEADFNPTGLQFDTYKITVPANQFMFDGSRRVSVPEGDDGTWLIRLFGYAKRMPSDKWFALIAGTCGDDKNDQSVDSNKPILKMPKETEYSGEAGELCFYVNDVLGYYQNNSGRVFINIKKL